MVMKIEYLVNIYFVDMVWIKNIDLIWCDDFNKMEVLINCIGSVFILMFFIMYLCWNNVDKMVGDFGKILVFFYMNV